MSARGYETTGIKCLGCDKHMPMSLMNGAMTEREITKLPDPFDATCPECGHTDQYPKSAIKTLKAE